MNRERRVACNQLLRHETWMYQVATRSAILIFRRSCALRVLRNELQK